MKHLLLSQGHKYLFWSIGVYYITLLSKGFRISLIVDETYRNDDDFAKICKKLKIVQVFYRPSLNPYNIVHHKRIKLFYREVLKIFPDLIVHYDYIEINNMYLSVMAQNLQIDTVVVETSQPSRDYTYDLLVSIRWSLSQRLGRRFRIPARIVCLTLGLLQIGKSFVGNRLLPKLMGINSYLSLSVFNNIDNIPTYLPFKNFIVYRNKDKSYLDRLLSLDDGIVSLATPSELVVGEEIDEILYGPAVVKKQLLFLPSHLMIGEFDEEKDAWQLWVSLLKRMCMKFGNPIVCIKFHPMTFKRSDYGDILSYLMFHIPNIQVIPAAQRVVPLLRESRIIVGDVSTALYQASCFAGKLVVSFDLGRTVGSWGMNDYQGINYLKADDPDLEEKLDLLKPATPVAYLQQHTVLDLIGGVLS